MIKEFLQSINHYEQQLNAVRCVLETFPEPNNVTETSLLIANTVFKRACLGFQRKASNYLFNKQALQRLVKTLIKNGSIK